METTSVLHSEVDVADSVDNARCNHEFAAEPEHAACDLLSIAQRKEGLAAQVGQPQSVASDESLASHSYPAEQKQDKQASGCGTGAEADAGGDHSVSVTTIEAAPVPPMLTVGCTFGRTDDLSMRGIISGIYVPLPHLLPFLPQQRVAPVAEGEGDTSVEEFDSTATFPGALGRPAGMRKRGLDMDEGVEETMGEHKSASSDSLFPVASATSVPFTKHDADEDSTPTTDPQGWLSWLSGMLGTGVWWSLLHEAPVKRPVDPLPKTKEQALFSMMTQLIAPGMYEHMVQEWDYERRCTMKALLEANIARVIEAWVAKNAYRIHSKSLEMVVLVVTEFKGARRAISYETLEESPLQSSHKKWMTKEGVGPDILVWARDRCEIRHW
jgi:hypothetical protein